MIRHDKPATYTAFHLFLTHMISHSIVPWKTKKWIKELLNPKVPSHLENNFITISENQSKILKQSLIKHFFVKELDPWFDNEYLIREEGKKDLNAQLEGRLNGFRRTIIPWLNEHKALDKANILEIGCGTGSSSIALAEQGANVTAIDVESEHIKVAQTRAGIYDLNINFKSANATEIEDLFPTTNFDYIIFFATLEHMTNDERIEALMSAWKMLRKDAFLCILETPNRLWFHDGHTSHLPFYSWLPDDLAFLYSKYSPRNGFNNLYRKINDELMLEFLRRGRGVSFHELDLTIGASSKLNVIDSLPIYLRKKSVLRRILWKITDESKFESYLFKVGPKIHKGFYQPFLDLIIKKE